MTSARRSAESELKVGLTNGLGCVATRNRCGPPTFGRKAGRAIEFANWSYVSSGMVPLEVVRELMKVGYELPLRNVLAGMAGILLRCVIPALMRRAGRPNVLGPMS